MEWLRTERAHLFPEVHGPAVASFVPFESRNTHDELVGNLGERGNRIVKFAERDSTLSGEKS
jgi:hypothetical protein